MLIRSIVVPIRQAVAVAEQVAAVTPGKPIRSHGTDETARLLKALSAMQTSLRETLQLISGTSTAIGGGCAQMNQNTRRFRSAATTTQ